MSIAPLPTPLQDFGGRRFSFYPPIRNLGPNEWLYRRATWSECVVANARSGEEFCIPRMFLGDVSDVEESVMIVRLVRELEWRGGAILPRERRVIVMPSPSRESDVKAHPDRLAAVVNIRLETKPETRIWKWIGVAAVLGAVALTIVADVAHQPQSHQRADAFRGFRSYLQLGPNDNYAATIARLGVPSKTSSVARGDHLLRLLTYAPRHYTVVLLSSPRREARYIGAVDTRGRVLDAVRLGDGSPANALLRSLPAF
ncbi:MAG TPA: hypothetical protein VG297_14005 [Bryobacteraceae bacterium]|jgi:hypothetical protein|nr:hypothetical protein [Bryobacteraceae bacterium]